MSKHIKDNEGREHVEASEEEAKQAQSGWSILYVLLTSLVGAVVVLGLVLAYFA
jgi:hypothetical protein